jgi:hypothetical protein
MHTIFCEVETHGKELAAIGLQVTKMLHGKIANQDRNLTLNAFKFDSYT